MRTQSNDVPLVVALAFNIALITGGLDCDWETVTLKAHTNMTQVGIPLELDIGVIDVNTCEPMEDVLISLWVCTVSSCNQCQAMLT